MRTGDNYNSKVLELALNGYPLVLMDRRMQGISIPCVRTDNYEAANEVTKILIAMGHKNLFSDACVRYDDNDP